MPPSGSASGKSGLRATAGSSVGIASSATSHVGDSYEPTQVVSYRRRQPAHAGGDGCCAQRTRENGYAGVRRARPRRFGGRRERRWQLRSEVRSHYPACHRTEAHRAHTGTAASAAAGYRRTHLQHDHSSVVSHRRAHWEQDGLPPTLWTDTGIGQLLAFPTVRAVPHSPLPSG